MYLDNIPSYKVRHAFSRIAYSSVTAERPKKATFFKYR